MRRHRHVQAPRVHAKSALGYRYLLRPTPANHPMLAGTVLGLPNQTQPIVLAPQQDQRRYLRAPRNQGPEGCCTGFDLTGFRAGVYGVDHKTVLGFDLSPAFVYWHERSYEGDTDRDAGAVLGDGMRVLQNIGVCPETAMPYVSGAYTVAPSQLAEQEAADWRLSQVASIDTSDLDALKYVLASGPVAVAFQVYQSFEATGPDGIVKMPDPDHEGFLGGHAILLAGYDDARKVWILRNSWGDGWGDHGDCYMPYGYEALWDEAWTGIA